MWFEFALTTQNNPQHSGEAIVFDGERHPTSGEPSLTWSKKRKSVWYAAIQFAHPGGAGNGNLFGGNRPDIQPHGRMDALKRGARNALFFELRITFSIGRDRQL